MLEALEPNGAGPWYSRYAWWNIFPLGFDRPGASLSEALWTAQYPLVGELFRASIKMLNPRRVVIVAGRDYWNHVADELGLAGLPRASLPVISAGKQDGRTFVVTYHPGAHIRGMTRERFAIAIADAILSVENE